MLIDTRKCIGCHACTVACVAENNLPPGVTYRTVHIVEDGDYPNVMRFFMPTNCMQCANPPCVKAANAVIPGAMGQRPDGIVTIDYTKMKGKPVFDAAKKACPYGYALYLDNGGNHTDGTPALQPYEQRESLEYGKRWKRADTIGATRKCHFCIQRIEAGVLPACVATCTGGAMHFGDANDPGSLVSELSAQRDKTFVLNQEAGTKPSNIYLHTDPLNAENSCMKCHEGGNLK
jgi:molybdopterin-containing oxidoreductase family iron-sulfur binding subunit